MHFFLEDDALSDDGVLRSKHVLTCGRRVDVGGHSPGAVVSLKASRDLLSRSLSVYGHSDRRLLLLFGTSWCLQT